MMYKAYILFSLKYRGIFWIYVCFFLTFLVKQLPKKLGLVRIIEVKAA